jgi:hypothetical protein
MEDVDVDNEASVMPQFGHQPSFGKKRSYLHIYVPYIHAVCVVLMECLKRRSNKAIAETPQSV